jgi:hypothetical protein
MHLLEVLRTEGDVVAVDIEIFSRGGCITLVELAYGASVNLIHHVRTGD